MENLMRHYPIQYYPNTKQPIHFSITYPVNNRLKYIYIDEDNWKYGVPESGLTQRKYQEYVINHELGHALGYGHVKCDKEHVYNSTCPVMYQSTRGCPEGYSCAFRVSPVDLLQRQVQ
jgi:hypothetical protein